MNEFLWNEIVNHRHDIVIPILVIVVIAYHYLDKWYFDIKFNKLYKLLKEIKENGASK